MLDENLSQERLLRAVTAAYRFQHVCVYSGFVHTSYKVIQITVWGIKEK